MKVNEFVNTAIKIANSPTVYYSVAGGAWCKWNGSSWNMDCVCMIKGILWGFDFNKNAPHGGAVINESVCPDVNADGLIKICTNVSTNFNNIEIGEVVHMAGHVGVYIGNRQVVESTAWFGRTIISNIGTDGKRTKDGKSGGYWKNHGKLPSVDYSGTPTPTPTGFNVGDRVNIETAYGYKYYVADEVENIYGTYQIAEYLNAGGKAGFTWRDNGIPEACVDIVDANGNKTADSDRVHIKKGNKFKFAKTFTIKAKTIDNGKEYVFLDFDGNANHRFWVVTEFLKKV